MTSGNKDPIPQFPYHPEPFVNCQVFTHKIHQLLVIMRVREENIERLNWLVCGNRLDVCLGMRRRVGGKARMLSNLHVERWRMWSKRLGVADVNDIILLSLGARQRGYRTKENVTCLQV